MTDANETTTIRASRDVPTRTFRILGIIHITIGRTVRTGENS